MAASHGRRGLPPPLGTEWNFGAGLHGIINHTLVSCFRRRMSPWAYGLIFESFLDVLQERFKYRPYYRDTLTEATWQDSGFS